MRSIRKTSASALIVALALAACNGPERGPKYKAAGRTAPYRGGTLHFSIIDGVRTLDPTIAYDEYSIYALHYMCDTLIGYKSATAGKGTELVPQLAERWSVSDDGKVYTFWLRKGVTFSDGQPLVAGDFKYAIERVLTSPASPFIQFLVGIEGAQALVDKKATSLSGLKIIDDHRLEFHLVEPDASFPMILAMKMATPQKRSHVEAAGKNIRRDVLCTGPFTLASWNEGVEMVFDRNPRYWDKKLPYLDRLDMLTNVPRDTAFLKFESGELDTVDRPSSADLCGSPRAPSGSRTSSTCRR